MLFRHVVLPDPALAHDSRVGIPLFGQLAECEAVDHPIRFRRSGVTDSALHLHHRSAGDAIKSHGSRRGRAMATFIIEHLRRRDHYSVSQRSGDRSAFYLPRAQC